MNGINQAFNGELPLDLKFSDLQKDVHKKAGKPTKSKKALRLDSWEQKDFHLRVEYHKENNAVEMIGYHKKNRVTTPIINF